MPIRPFANSPIPSSDPISSPARKELTDAGQTDTLAGLVSSPWNEWFSLLSGQLNVAPFVQNQVSFDGQTASIGATDFTGGALSGGFYDVRYYVRVTTPASVSSSIQVTFSWTDDGVTLSFAGTILTGNTTTTGTSQSAPFIAIDAGSPVTFSTAYASVGTPMAYKIGVCIIQVPS